MEKNGIPLVHSYTFKGSIDLLDEKGKKVSYKITH